MNDCVLLFKMIFQSCWQRLTIEIWNTLYVITMYRKIYGISKVFRYLSVRVMDKTNFYFFSHDHKNVKTHENPQSSDKRVWSDIKHRLVSSLWLRNKLCLSVSVVSKSAL